MVHSSWAYRDTSWQTTASMLALVLTLPHSRKWSNVGFNAKQ